MASAAKDATAFLVIGMHNTGFVVEAITDDSTLAITSAKELADQNEGSIYGVYRKIGTARTRKAVDYKEC